MDAQYQVDALMPSHNITRPLHIPLCGRTLIEASAGTGKTYTLSLLYLRLLLGIGQSSFLRPLTTEEILVVTFTNAATEALRHNIKETVHHVRVACLRGYHPDPQFNELLAQLDDLKHAAKILLMAEQQMDEAAIYTIHGFCQRVLTTNAFESGILFEFLISNTMNETYLQLCQDFWRRFFNPLPLGVAKQIKAEWKTPDELAKIFLPHLKRYGSSNRLTTCFISQTLILSVFTSKLDKIIQVKKEWQCYRGVIAQIIHASGVNKRSYSKRTVPVWLAKVDEWVQQSTEDFTVPKALVYFSTAVLTAKSLSNPPKHRLFDLIGALYEEGLTLQEALFEPILATLAQSIFDEKQRRGEIEPDDLLVCLNNALTTCPDNKLAHKLAIRYPVALIDEFQDTDEIQYQIFNHIYHNRSKTGLILIGDPKQSIYGFRGADIFVYINAKKSADHYFTMTTNWRSTAAMVAGINQLFLNQSKPFIFEDIPFIRVNPALKNQVKRLDIADNSVGALQYYLLPHDMDSIEAYCRESAEIAAKKIHYLLHVGARQQAYFVDQHGKNQITATGIAVLVRNRREARIMKTALLKRGVQSVFLSNRESVFGSFQAKELFWLLQAILSPHHPEYLFTALATRLLALDMHQLDSYQTNQGNLEDVIEEFDYYHKYWLKFGLLAMLRYMMKKRNMAENILAMKDGERILTDLMHLSELLQKRSEELDSQHALLRWLATQITDLQNDHETHQQRLESDENLVKIVTIHKSKGLEYPIVFLPFLCSYKKSMRSDSVGARDNHSNQAMQPDEGSTLSSDQLRLAEDLRLCYVALTRSIYLGVIGVVNWNSPKIKLQESALGYLIQQGQEGDRAFLKECLAKLPALTECDAASTLPRSASVLEQRNALMLTANRFKRQFMQDWGFSSYSSLCSSYQSASVPVITDILLPAFDLDAREDEFNQNEHNNSSVPRADHDITSFSIHGFPKGAKVGTALHRLLEKLNFTLPHTFQDLSVFKQQLNLSDEWDPFLRSWITGILTTPLSDDGLSLCQISQEKKLNELAFYFPIRSKLDASAIEQVSKQYDPISIQCGDLNFVTISGMLTGYIDLIFEWKGKFYLLDYKSNWLGPDFSSYQNDSLVRAMVVHRYDLQYQLYSLALHRYLQHRLPYYDYEYHFGGVYYLFLRGMTPEIPKNGVFFHKPAKEFIDKFDQLFD